MKTKLFFAFAVIVLFIFAYFIANYDYAEGYYPTPTDAPINETIVPYVTKTPVPTPSITQGNPYPGPGQDPYPGPDVHTQSVWTIFLSVVVASERISNGR